MSEISVPSADVQYIQQAAQLSGLPYNVVAAQVNDESGFNDQAVSSAGAEGPYQFLPSTYSTYSTGNPAPNTPYNWEDGTIAYGRFMKSLLTEFNGNVEDALAAYNAGPANIGAGMGYASSILSASGEPVTTTAGGGTANSVSSDIQNLIPGWLQGILSILPGGLDPVRDIDDFIDWAERLGLIILGAVFIIIGIVKFDKGGSSDRETITIDDNGGKETDTVDESGGHSGKGKLASLAAPKKMGGFAAPASQSGSGTAGEAGEAGEASEAAEAAEVAAV